MAASYRVSTLDDLDYYGYKETLTGRVRHELGIASVFQPKERAGGDVPLVLLLSRAVERNLRDALAEIEGLPSSRGPAVAVRLEDFDA